MNKLSLALLGASMSMLTVVPAMAADIYGGSTKDSGSAVVGVPSSYSWAGPYVGLHAGFGVGRGVNDMSFDHENDVSDTISVMQDDDDYHNFVPLFSTEDELSGVIYGGQAGYNFQYGRIVFGIEGSLSGTDISGKEAGSGIATFFETETSIDWLGLVEGRLGFASGGTLFYLHGGLAVADVSTVAKITSGLDNPKGSARLGEVDETRYGWVAGVGIEHALGNDWTARVNYSYIDLGEESSSTTIRDFDGDPVGSFGMKSDVTINAITVGVNRRF